MTILYKLWSGFVWNSLNLVSDGFSSNILVLAAGLNKKWTGVSNKAAVSKSYALSIVGKSGTHLSPLMLFKNKMWSNVNLLEINTITGSSYND